LSDSEITVDSPSILGVKHCLVKGGYQGTGNIDGDPLFTDPSNEDFHLLKESPCIDAGTTQGAPACDSDGDMRPSLAGIDIGVDEFTGGAPSVLK